MNLNQISAGKNFPEEFNVIIEIPAQSGPVKYEVDKASGLLMVDRFMSTPMFYPCNYGFIPHTLAEDGDPMDVLVFTPHPLEPGCLIKSRAIGLLRMTDEAGKDSKIFALPILKVCPQLAHIKTLNDLPKSFLDSIVHFFEHYKDLEPNKWVKVDGWEDKSAAELELKNSVERCQTTTI